MPLSHVDLITAISNFSVAKFCFIVSDSNIQCYMKIWAPLMIIGLLISIVCWDFEAETSFKHTLSFLENSCEMTLCINRNNAMCKNKVSYVKGDNEDMD